MTDGPKSFLQRHWRIASGTFGATILTGGYALQGDPLLTVMSASIVFGGATCLWLEARDERAGSSQEVSTPKMRPH